MIQDITCEKMEKRTILPILKKIPLFNTFNDEDYRSIIEHIQLQYFPKDYVVFSEKDEGDTLYIIKDGNVKIIHPSIINGKEERIAVLNENNFFGEMALFSNEPRNASAVTLTECELFTLKREDFYELLLKDKNMASRVSEEFMRRVRDNNHREM